MRLRSLLLLVLLAVASPASAQLVRFPSVEIGTVSVGCRYQSLNVTDDNPNGDVSGSICDQVNETTTGVVWTKTSGTATTSGWVALTSSASTGTVTSVALTAPGIFSVSGTPITTSGTLALSLATQSAKTFFAGPASGSAAAPTFRQPVLADLAQSSATTGQIPKWDGTVWAAADDAGAASGAPVGVQYVTLATDATLTNERVLTAGTGITLTDGGAGSTITVAASGGGGGGLVLVEQDTASASATLDFTTCITSTYDEYVIEFLNLIPATDGAFPWLRMSTDGGATYDTGTNYQYDQFVWRLAGTAVRGGTGQTKIVLFEDADGISNTTTYGLSGSARLFSPLSTALFKVVTGKFRSFGSGTGTFVNTELGGAYVLTTAANAFRFLYSTGNITSGTIRCYGLAK